jgi:hypothetical protein
LLNTWEEQAREDAGVLDDKLADYVFFPVSHVLRSQDVFPIIVIEITIKLVKVLIQYGWKSKLSRDLSQQLLIFLTFIVGGVPGQPRERIVPEETILEGYRALSALIGSTGPAVNALLEDKLVPTLGHAVSVILQGVTDGATPEIQLAALECLDAFYLRIKDQSALASFLPGTVSALTRALAPPASAKTPTRILLKGVHVFQAVFVTVLGDLRTRCISSVVEDAEILQGPEDTDLSMAEIEADVKDTRKVLTPAWLRATASQIKIALASILKLRTHDSEKIHAALYTFCIRLLDECHNSLVECKTMLVETAMVTQPTEVDANGVDTTLEDMASIYPELGDTIKSVMYNWVTGLPRSMQSSDERVKQQAIRNFLKGNKLVEALQLKSSTLEDSISDALKDSVVALIKNSAVPKVINEETEASPMKAVTMTTSELAAGQFRPVILAMDSQRSTRKEVESLISSIGSATQQIKLASEMLSSLRDSEGVEQIASFWLAFELVKASYTSTSSDELDSFLDFSSTVDHSQQETALQELFDFSATLLASHSDTDEVDWRLEAMALEVAAFTATRMEQDFHPELIDVLYPITAFMGSQNRQLRSHAVTTLNMIAASCNYTSVSDLIIDNVDYMVNSLSLRLNTFDISPASTRVLTMMIRLSGPELLPFLDDVVASIFAALDNYHGYAILVESLFSVLSEVVEQGAKSDQLLLATGSAEKPDHKKKPPQAESMQSLLSILDNRMRRSSTEPDADLPRSHPNKPWGPPKNAKPQSFLETFEEIHAPTPDDDQDDSQPEPSKEVEKRPPPPTYTLLSRIITLTQHHLTSPSPTLRRRLLDLLSRAAPALAVDEDSFLPLVNAVWPVIVGRLRDSEPFVVTAACDTLASLCDSAGDFLASRVKTEWGEWMGRWCVRAKDQAKGEAGEKRREQAGRQGAFSGSLGRTHGVNIGGQGRAGGGGGDILLPMRGGIVAADPAPLSSTPMEGLKLVQTGGSEGVVASRAVGSSSELGRFSQASQVWSAVTRLLTAIVSYVRLDDGIFDQVLELLVDVAATDDLVRSALEDVNADAVWLALYEHGRMQPRDAVVPVMAGVAFRPLVDC